MSAKYNTISILGCGWLGWPLAQRLVKQKWEVKGATTRDEKLSQLQQDGIQPFKINLGQDPENPMPDEFFHSDILFVNIPPGREQARREAYPTIMQEIAKKARSKVDWVIFISSTSVYPSKNGSVQENEDQPDKANGAIILEAENVFKNSPDFKTTVVRFCGLAGGERKPGRFLAGKQGVKGPDNPVNLIHLDDCLEIIQKILVQAIQNETFNACADKHPSREELYIQAARKVGLEAPTFDKDTPENFKIVDSSKLKSLLKYDFIHPDPMEFI